jgi:hypothetical protein
MRLTVGKWLAGSGLAIAALAGVPASLNVPAVAWGLFIAGLVITICGLVFALRGETPDERRMREHERTVARNALENERGELNGRRAQIEGELTKQTYWASVADNCNDTARSAVIAGEIATLTAERDGIDRRLAQIEAELASA